MSQNGDYDYDDEQDLQLELEEGYAEIERR
jgi:hypothetical protein